MCSRTLRLIVQTSPSHVDAMTSTVSAPLPWPPRRSSRVTGSASVPTTATPLEQRLRIRAHADAHGRPLAQVEDRAVEVDVRADHEPAPASPESSVPPGCADARSSRILISPTLPVFASTVTTR